LQTSLNATASEQEELAKALTAVARTADTNAQAITAALAPFCKPRSMLPQST
jgi:hypothetical protein